MVMLETVQRVANESNSAVAFLVRRGTAQTIVDGGWRKIELDTEVFDEGSNFASYKFVAPVDGIYHFSGGVHVDLTSGERFITALYKNGTGVLRGTDIGPSTATAEAAGVVSGVLKLSATDYIELYCYYDGTGNTLTKAGEGLTYLCGYLVGTT